MNKKLLLSLLFPIALILLIIFIAEGSTGFNFIYKVFSADKYEFASQIDKCNETDTENRFSCYRNVLEKYYDGSLDNLTTWVEGNKHISFENRNYDYAIFGTNCHTFYHAMGDYVATKGDGKKIDTLVDYGTNKCTSGYIMGLYKRVALQNQFDSQILSKFYDLCPESSKHSCAHEVGHILNDKYVYSILRTIDEISKEEYSLNYTKNYQYTTFKDPDLKSPFDDCENLVPENELPYCYTGVGHNVFIFSEFSPGGYEDLLADCREKAGEQEDNCYNFFIYRIGINDVATKFLDMKFEKGREVCTEVINLANRPESKLDCYIGLGGGIGLFLESEFASKDINQDNLRYIQERVLNHIKLCEEAEEGFKQACYKGLLGTGVRDLYQELNIHHSVIEKVLPKISDDFDVVG